MNNFSNNFAFILPTGAFKKKMDVLPFTASEDCLLNGGKGDEV